MPCIYGTFLLNFFYPTQFVTSNWVLSVTHSQELGIIGMEQVKGTYAAITHIPPSKSIMKYNKRLPRARKKLLK